MIEIFCDGAASPNPGHGGIGFVVFNDDALAIRGQQYLGPNITNNMAEFTAAINGLLCINQHLKYKEVTLYSDSKLVIGSMTGEMIIRDEKLIPFHEALEMVEKMFDNVNFSWIPRIKNRLADSLARRAVTTKKSRIVQFGE